LNGANTLEKHKSLRVTFRLGGNWFNPIGLFHSAIPFHKTTVAAPRLGIGVVVYELLSEAVISGNDVAETLASLVKDQPEARCPFQVRRLLKPCPQKMRKF